MGVERPQSIDREMATRWRRRRLCVLIAEMPVPAALREITGAGAFVETGARPRIGSLVELHHPEAGMIGARVEGLASDGIRLRFEPGEAAVAFALSAIAADMSRPAA